MSPAAPARTRYESRRSKGYPCPPLPQSRYAQKFHQGCAKLGWNSFPTPQAALSRPLQRPAGDGHQRLRPAARRPDRHPLQRAQRVHPQALATGRFDLRPNAYVSEITVDERGRAKSAVYADEDGTTYEQEADVFILACGAVETARLLLLSKSARFPNGLANGSDLVGRNVTFHEYSAAVGTFRRPDLRLGRRRLRQRQHLRVLRARRQPRASSAAATSPAPASASRCRSTGRCPTGPLWGAGSQDRSTATTSTTAWPWPWWCTTCRSTTTESSSTTRSPTPGVCRSPGSRSPRTRTT